MFLIEGVLRSKNLFSESLSERPITKDWTPFQTPSAIIGPPVGHFGFSRQYGIAGGTHAATCDRVVLVVLVPGRMTAS